MVIESKEQFSGPGYFGLGDPVGGGGMIDFGLSPEVSVKLDFMRQGATNEIGQQLADGQYGAVVGGQIAVTLHKQTAVLWAQAFPEITDLTSGRGFETAFKKLALDTALILPIAAYGALGGADPEAMWAPAVRPDDISELRRVLQSGAGASDDANPYTITFALTRRKADQADQDLDSKGQIFFMGNPDNVLPVTPTSWAGPTGYAAP